jgi:hypothetical protein
MTETYLAKLFYSYCKIFYRYFKFGLFDVQPLGVDWPILLLLLVANYSAVGYKDNLVTILKKHLCFDHIK